MSTQNSLLVRDNSTLANFKSWASTISAFFATAGWVQSSDTGQVVWGSIASVPAANAYVYEIWKPGDALTTFYLKIEYGTGTSSSNTNPRIRVSIGTTTNGAGTLTGFVTTLQLNPQTDVTVSSTVTTFNCYFSGDTSRIGVLMWRDDAANAGPVFFGVQRSLNSSGAATSSYVTLLSLGHGASGAAWQQTVVFGVGIANLLCNPGTSGTGGFNVLKSAILSSDNFNGNLSISPAFPDVGYFDNPMDIIAVGCLNDFTEGSSYTIAAGNMPYGVSHIYLAGKGNPLYLAGWGGSSNNCCFLMRYD